MTIKEFTKVADVYESDQAGIYEICKDDYPYIAAELDKEEYYDLLDCGIAGEIKNADIKHIYGCTSYFYMCGYI